MDLHSPRTAGAAPADGGAGDPAADPALWRTKRRIDRAFRAILSAAQIVGLARSGEHQSLLKAIATASNSSVT